MEIQLNYFKSWKMMLWKCCTQYASTFGKLSSGHRTGQSQFSFQSQRKAMPKNAQSKAKHLLSHVRLFAIPWTVAYQASPSWDSPGKNTGVGCHFLLRGSSQPRDQTWVFCITGRFFAWWQSHQGLILNKLSMICFQKQLFRDYQTIHTDINIYADVFKSPMLFIMIFWW